MNILDLKRQAQGWHYQCSDAPDMSGQNAAALAQAEMSKEQLAWAKQIYAETAPDRADATQRANAVSDAQLESMNTQTAMAKDYDAYNKSTFRPLEQQVVREANEYDTPERRAAASAEAMAGVEQQISAQREAANRNLERSGVVPGSGKSLAMEGQMGIGAAKLKAGAGNAAAKQIETIGAAKKMDALGLGKGLVGSQATSAGLALTAGNNSAVNGQAAGNITAQGNQIMTSGFAGAQSGMAGAASTYGSIANTEMKANDNSAVWGAVGTVAGAYL